MIADFDVGIAVGGFGDLIGDQFALTDDFCVFAAHETFDRKDGVLRISHSLTFCSLTDQTLSGLGESHDGGGGAVAFRVGDDFILAVIHYSHTAVGGSEVDSKNFTHDIVLLFDFLIFWIFSLPPIQQ